MLDMKIEWDYYSFAVQIINIIKILRKVQIARFLTISMLKVFTSYQMFSVTIHTNHRILTEKRNSTDKKLICQTDTRSECFYTVR